MPVAMVIVLMWSTFAHVFENAVYQFLGLILLFFFFLIPVFSSGLFWLWTGRKEK